ncbi:hypothetical protein KL86PLE_30006 [uncultured Pleomorphomonas sp.]|uniref:Uncharacterized protein n=1 Tax=uncultured Pleomorphomonas sp. TaxID=442121 RepID=A0A212LDX4_9HYPH|nr:hypothetical protein KL86PLE_30006 [uncultured Pleomorphomonas sp.]
MSALEPRTEKWEPVFGQSDAITKNRIVALRPSGRMAIRTGISGKSEGWFSGFCWH